MFYLQGYWVLCVICGSIQVDNKKHANWLFLVEIIKPNLPKYAYNLIRGRRVGILSPVVAFPIPSVPKSRSKLSKN